MSNVLCLPGLGSTDHVLCALPSEAMSNGDFYEQQPLVKSNGILISAGHCACVCVCVCVRVCVCRYVCMSECVCVNVALCRRNHCVSLPVTLIYVNSLWLYLDSEGDWTDNSQI